MPAAGWATAGWAVDGAAAPDGGCTMFRIFQTGLCAAGNQSLVCAGIELYGTLHIAVDAV
jgi:hypothetical protein